MSLNSTKKSQKKIKLYELKLNEKNPRRIKKENLEKLKNSIKEFPKMLEYRPILIDDDGVIVAGNMRVMALKQLGYEEIPESWVKKISELSENEKKRIMLIDNSYYGEWDFDKLANEFGSEFLKEININIPELDEILEEKLEISEIENYYNNDRAIYPIVARFDEKYDAFIIICETEEELALIRTKFNIPEKLRDYKTKFLGKNFVVRAKEILNNNEGVKENE
jgi:hypothetical protein